MQKSQTILDKAAFYIILGILFLAPTFFVPSASVSLSVGKSALIILLSAAAFFLWLVGRLKEGSYSFPKSWFYGSFILLFVSYGIATIFSASIRVSFFGQGLSIGSFAFVASVLVLAFLIPQIAVGEKKIFSLYSALFISFLVVAIYEIVKLTIGAPSFGILTGTAANLVGGWNDLAIFAGLVAILSMIALDTLELSAILKPILYVCLVLSLLLVALAGFFELWIVFGLIALSLFIYQLSFKRGERGERNIAYHSLVVLLISALFIFGGSAISAYLGNAFNISQLSVRPSWSATGSIIQASLAQNPLVGVGPERFAYEWLLHKPTGVNGTVFWNTNFGYGVGFVPSIVAMIGIIGTLALLIYIVFLLLSVAKSFVTEPKTNLGAYFLLAGVSGTVYLWVLAFLYVPGPAVLALTFAFSGILISTLSSQGAFSAAEFSVIGKPVRSFVSVLLTVLVLIAVVAFAYSVSKDALASFYFGKASIAASAGDSDLAISDIQSALALSPDASYDRALTDVYISQINTLISTSQPNQTDAAQKLQSLLASAISAGQSAVSLDPMDYSNYLELGKVYAAVVPLKVNGAYDAAKSAFDKSLALNPQDPEIDLAEAELSLANGDTAGAETSINSALAKKSDYADAIYLLSQIEISQGKVADAINSVKSVAVLSPNDPGVFFQLGLLEYSQKDYQSAAQALNKAVALSPGYANAEYYLGLSDYYNGDVTDAITQFEDLAKTNGDNTTVTSVLENLKAGKTPFAGEPASSKNGLPVSQ